MLSVFCAGCDKSYRVKEEQAGKKLKCPQGHVLVVPASVNGQPPDTERAASQSEVIEMHCACGKKLRFKLEHAGKQAKCPGCGQAVQIAAATNPTVEPPAVYPAGNVANLEAADCLEDLTLDARAEAVANAEAFAEKLLRDAHETPTAPESKGLELVLGTVTKEVLTRAPAGTRDLSDQAAEEVEKKLTQLGLSQPTAHTFLEQTLNELKKAERKATWQKFLNLFGGSLCALAGLVLALVGAGMGETGVMVGGGGMVLYGLFSVYQGFRKRNLAEKVLMRAGWTPPQ